MPAFWTVERTPSRKFPFRVSIEQDGRALLTVRAQSSWPGPGQQVFCLRERVDDPAEFREAIERVNVVRISQIGRKIAVVLDRPTRKRCEFLVVRKLTQQGKEVEQVFFRTTSGIKAHRSRTRPELTRTAATLTIAVDSAERYPWRFPGATLLRRPLAAGDYALMAGGVQLAVVERKTFEGLLTDIGAVQALHHQLADLASLPGSVVVVEAQYGDFLDPARLAGRWPPAHVARLLAELAALHPGLPLVYAGNRKLANAWCAEYFAATASRRESPQLDLVRETLARYNATPRSAALEDQIRAAALATASDFSTAELSARFPAAGTERVRRVLGQLAEEGLLERTGRGRGTRWQRNAS
jgi:hypothetical protein